MKALNFTFYRIAQELDPLDEHFVSVTIRSKVFQQEIVYHTFFPMFTIKSRKTFFILDLNTNRLLLSKIRDKTHEVTNCTLCVENFHEIYKFIVFGWLGC